MRGRELRLPPDFDIEVTDRGSHVKLEPRCTPVAREQPLAGVGCNPRAHDDQATSRRGSARLRERVASVATPVGAAARGRALAPSRARATP